MVDGAVVTGAIASFAQLVKIFVEPTSDVVVVIDTDDEDVLE